MRVRTQRLLLDMKARKQFENILKYQYAFTYVFRTFGQPVISGGNTYISWNILFSISGSIQNAFKAKLAGFCTFVFL